VLRYSCFIFSFCFINISIASESVGKIVFLRGEVAIVSKGDSKARYLKLNEDVLEDSTITTHDKSICKVRFKSGSTITIAPNSKALIREDITKGRKTITLMVGKVKNIIQPRDRKHFYVKTTSAVMGVRGTSFVVSYSPEAQVTSVVTLEGEVALLKRDNTKSDLENLEKVNLKPDELVRASEFSKTSVLISKASEPVKIDSLQTSSLSNEKFYDEKKYEVNEKMGKFVHLNSGIVFDASEVKVNSYVKNGSFKISKMIVDPKKGVLKNNVVQEELTEKVKNQLPPRSILPKLDDPYEEID
jgi:hypothetical protein